MNNYENFKQDIIIDLRKCFLEDFSDLIEIQVLLISWYRHAYCSCKNDYITHDEATNIGVTLKATVRMISYTLYNNNMISIDDIINFFNENIEFYENC